MRTLKNGMSGTDVGAWNEFLGKQRLLPPNGVNDKFDAATEAATVKFQKVNGVRQTGQVDQATIQQAHRVGLARFQAQATESASNFDLTKLPEIMKKNNWMNAARLMEQWFEGKANDNPNVGVPDTTTIKMDSWILTFPKASEVYNKLISEQIWINEAAQIEICKMLIKLGKITNKLEYFGNFSSSIQEIDRNYINFRSVDIKYMEVARNELDDLCAALGSFTFRVVVKGNVAPYSQISTNGSVYRIVIEDVGIYIRDSYDFNNKKDSDGKEEDQNLGHWNYKTNEVSAIYRNEGRHIHNSDFQKWRNDNKKGRDYLIFSDLKILKRNKPDVFLKYIRTS